MRKKPDQLDIVEAIRFAERAKRASESVLQIVAASDAKAKHRPRARGTDPATSHRAAKRAGEKLTWSQQSVMECMEHLRTRGVEYVTDPDLIAAYKRGLAHIDNNWPWQSDSGLRTRRHELVEAEKLEAVGEEKGPSGRTFTRWAIKRETT